MGVLKANRLNHYFYEHKTVFCSGLRGFWIDPVWSLHVLRVHMWVFWFPPAAWHMNVTSAGGVTVGSSGPAQPSFASRQSLFQHQGSLMRKVSALNQYMKLCMCLIYYFNIVSVCTVSSSGSSPGVCLLPSSFFICDYAPGLQHTRFYSNKTCNQNNKNKNNMSNILNWQGNQGTKGAGFVWDLFTCWWWTLSLVDLLHLSLFTLKLLKRWACRRDPLLVWANTTFIGSAVTLKAELVGGFFLSFFFLLLILLLNLPCERN